MVYRKLNLHSVNVQARRPLTTSEDTLPPAPRETCTEASLVWCFVVAKADVPIDAMCNIIRREWRDLRVRLSEQIGEFADESFPLFLGKAEDWF